MRGNYAAITGQLVKRHKVDSVARALSFPAPLSRDLFSNTKVMAQASYMPDNNIASSHIPVPTAAEFAAATAIFASTPSASALFSNCDGLPLVKPGELASASSKSVPCMSDDNLVNETSTDAFSGRSLKACLKQWMMESMMVLSCLFSL